MTALELLLLGAQCWLAEMPREEIERQLAITHPELRVEVNSVGNQRH